jgi:hypothetical protein
MRDVPILYGLAVPLIYSALLMPQSSCAQDTPPTVDVARTHKSPTAETWAGYASYQTYSRRDFITPIILKGISKAVHGPQHLQYSKLVQEGLSIRREYEMSDAYARTKHLSDPVAQEREAVDWAKRLAGLKSTPLTVFIGQAASLLTDTATVVSDRLTSLSDQQGLELHDLLYRSGFKGIHQTYLTVFKVATSDARARDAYNLFLRNSLDIETSDDVERMRDKAAPYVTLLETDQLLSNSVDSNRALGYLTSTVTRLGENLSTEMSEIKATQTTLVANQKEQADFETRELERQQTREATRAVVYLLSTVIADKTAANRLYVIGTSLLTAAESLETFHKALTSSSKAVLAKASLICLASEVQMGLTIVSLFTPQENDSALILQELNAIKQMISDLYKLTARGFEDVQYVLERFQTQNAEAFNLLIVQARLLQENVDAVRIALSVLSAQVDETYRGTHKDIQALVERTFQDLQQECYLDYRTGQSHTVVTPQVFERCLRKFALFATADAKSTLYTDVNGSQTGLNLPDDVYEHLNLLSAEAAHLGAHFSGGVFGNPIVWNSAVNAFLATIETWPQYRHLVTIERVRGLINAGDSMTAQMRSLFVKEDRKVDATKSPSERLRAEIEGTDRPDFLPFEPLFHLYRDALLNFQQALRVERLKYVASTKEGVDVLDAQANPEPGDPDGLTGNYSIFLPDKYSSEAIAVLETQIGPKIPQCPEVANDFLDAYLPLPEHIISWVNWFRPDFSAAARLDPTHHKLSACYGITDTDRHSYLVKQGSSETVYYVASIDFFVDFSVGDGDVFEVFNTLPRSIVTWTPAGGLRDDDIRYPRVDLRPKEGDTFPTYSGIGATAKSQDPIVNSPDAAMLKALIDQQVAQLTYYRSQRPEIVKKWQKDHLATFLKVAGGAEVVDEQIDQATRKDPKCVGKILECEQAVLLRVRKERSQRLALLICSRTAELLARVVERSKAVGDVQNAARALDQTKHLIEGYALLAFPISLRADATLQSLIFGKDHLLSSSEIVDRIRPAQKTGGVTPQEIKSELDHNNMTREMFDTPWNEVTFNPPTEDIMHRSFVLQSYLDELPVENDPITSHLLERLHATAQSLPAQAQSSTTSR